MNIETTKALEIIELSSVKYNVQNFGLRFLPKGDEVKVGQVLKTSFEQIDDQDEYELDGLSTIGLNYDGYELCDFDKSLDKIDDVTKELRDFEKEYKKSKEIID